MLIARIVVLALILAPAGANAGELSITVEVAKNLADAVEAMPILHVHNDSLYTVEFLAFHGVPHSVLEEQSKTGFSRDTSARCGNGFRPRSLAPGQYETFPLWSKVGHGPGKSGTYRFAFPYTEKRPRGRRAREAMSAPVTINYGDIAPDGWKSKAPSSGIVLTGSRFEVVDKKKTQSHTGAALASHFLPEINTCVKQARKLRPWIRGRFSLVAYKYRSMKEPITYLGSSLLGVASLGKCLGRLKAPVGLVGKYELSFVVPHPL